MAAANLTPVQAYSQVRERFPFDGYIHDPFPDHLNLFHAVKRHLPAGSTILDFGSGPGDNTAILHLMGYRCTAADDLQDPWHRKPGNLEKILAFAEDIGVRFVVTDGQPLPFEAGEFDMVILTHVLEHLHDSPAALLNMLLGFVKPQGYLLVKVPNLVNIRKRIQVLRGRTNLAPFDFFYWHPSPWRGHVREYTGDDCLRLANNLGLKVEEFRSVHDMLFRVPRGLRQLYLATTTVFTGWRDTWLIVARKPPDWTPRLAPPESMRQALAPPDF